MEKELLILLKEFIEVNATQPDFQIDPNIEPKLPVNPYSKNYDEKRRIAHYFLFVASIDEGNLVGAAENARKLMVGFYDRLGEELFEITDTGILKEAFNYARLGLGLGRLSKLIPRILASVNVFVKHVAHGDLIEFAKRFHNPYSFVNMLGENIIRMGKSSLSTRKKAWMYMRWMVRGYPDLRIFENFLPSDLYVPLDRHVARVAKCLGILSSTNNLTWREVERVTKFAKKLYPDDPAKIDYPFFLLGRMLRQRYRNCIEPCQDKLKSLLREFLQH